jgi:ComF family protein
MLKKFLEVLFPSHCCACDQIISKEGIFCQECWTKLRFITDPKCPICSHPFEVTIAGMQPWCGSCLTKRPSYNKAVVALRYDGVIAKVISDFKYRDQTFLAEKLATLLWNRASSQIGAFDLVVAVPMHQQKLRQRKFNQVVLLGKKLAKKSGAKFFPNLLLKVKDTAPQASLKQRERRKNLKRAFLVNPKFRDEIASEIKGKKILLIDDVITTGATIESCAKELKRRGAAKIVVLAIARTVVE